MARYFGIAQEYVFRTAKPASVYTDLIPPRESIVPDQGWIIPDSIANRAYQKKVLGAFRARGNIAFPVEPENGIGWYLKWVLGSHNKAQQGGTSAWKHTFKSADAIKSFTGRIGADTDERLLKGCLLNALTLRFAHGAEVRGIAEVLASEESKAAIGTPTFSELDPFVFSQATVEFAGTAKAIVAEGEVRINNRIPFDRGVLGDRYFPKIKVGKRLVDGRLSLWFDDSTEYDRFLAGTDFKLELLTTGPAISVTGYNYTLNIIMTKCVYLRDTAPHPDRRELIILDAPFQAFYDPQTSPEIKTEITVELINEKTDYADPTS